MILLHLMHKSLFKHFQFYTWPAFKQWLIINLFLHAMLLHTQQEPLKEGLHIKYNIDDMTYKKW